jgi:autotransporter-associated beta strand protein
MKLRILSVERLSLPLASALAALLAAIPASAATYYWDNSPGVAGFGSALGTWSASTDPALNSPLGSGWSTSSTGAAATVIGAVTTATEDTLNFGSATTILAAGTVSLGTVNSGSIAFGSTSNGIVLSGGTITLAAAPSITVSNANTTHFIGSVLAGAGTSLTKAGSGTLVLSGANTYTGRTVISGGRLFINSIKDVGGVANAAGQPLLADATIAIGSTTAVGNLTYLGTGDSTDRVINLAGTTGGATIDHSGTGLLKFNSAFTATGNGVKTLSLQGLTSGTGEISGAIVDSSSSTALTKSGSGTWILSGANSYSGRTTVNGGMLTLAFGAVASDIISPASALTLGGGTLQLVGTGNQTLNGLTTTLNTGSRIVLGAGQTLTLGALTSAGSGSSLNINTLAGGANASSSTVGTGIVVLTGPTPGDAISSGYTISDAGGFGLATVDGSNQVVRQTTGSTLLPASGALPSIDYRVDNNAVGGAAGSSSLTLTATADARSITVDTSAASGVLTLNPGVEFYNSMWHFGGVGTNAYLISGGDGGAGLSSFASGDTISINNHNAGPVTFASPILGSGNSGVSLNGAGTTVFSGSNLYTGRTTVNAGTLKVTGGTSVIGTLFLGAAAYQQDGSGTSVTLTGGTEMNLGLAGTSTFTLSGGTFSVQTSSAAAANIGHGGDATFNQTGGLFHFAPTGANKLVNIGVTATGSATLNLSGGTFQTAADVPAYLGGRVNSVMNISGSAMVDIPNLLFNRNLSVPHTATLNLGDGTPGSGTLKTSSITKNSPAIHNVSIFNFNGGTLQAGASSATFMSGLTTASVMGGGALIDTNGFDITIAQPLLRFPGATAGGLTKKGTGILTLSGINSYRGNTTVSDGTLTLGSAEDLLNANPGNDLSTVTIAAGAILDLTYTGTDKLNKLFIGVTEMAEGVYGKSGSVPPVIGISQITGDGTLSVVPVFASWITRTFANGTVPLDRQGADDDFDNDGISNLIEYALAGQDPTVPNPVVGTFTAGILGFAKRPEAIGLSYAIQESTDLGVADDWTEVSGGGYVNNAGGISYTLTPGSPARNFIRLQVTAAP